MKKEQEIDLFERDGFTQTTTMKHPVSGAEMRFTQWEAKYMGDLEFDNRNLRTLVRNLENTIAFQAELNSKMRRAAEKESRVGHA